MDKGGENGATPGLSPTPTVNEDGFRGNERRQLLGS